MQKKIQKFWRIEGYDSTTLIYKAYRPLNYYSDGRMSQLISVLTAKAGLEFNEIVDSKSDPDGNPDQCEN